MNGNQESNAQLTEGAHVLDLDPAQLAQLLAQSTDGSAQLIDEHGNTITLTPEQLAEAGINLDTLEGAQVLQLQEGSQFIQGEDGQIYVIESAADQAPPQLEPETTVHKTPTTAMPGIKVTTGGASPVSHTGSAGPFGSEAFKDVGQMQQLVDDYRRTLQDREAKVNELEMKLRDTSEQNLILSHALVSTCKSQDVEVLVQSADGQPGKRQIVSVRKSGPGEIPPEGSYTVTDEGGETHIVTPGVRSNRYQHVPSRGRGVQNALLPFQCDQCPRRFGQENHLRRHQDMAHAKKRPFFCRFCNRDLYLSSDMHFQGHLRMQHKQEYEIEAAYGSTLSRSTASSQPSSKSVAGNGEESEEEEPDWDIVDLDKFRGYAGDVEDDPSGISVKCNICEKQLPNVIFLRNHLRDDHGITNEQRLLTLAPAVESAAANAFRCSVCQKGFHKQEHLDKHRIVHTEQIPFSCQYCPKRYRWKENLMKHLIWHNERMPFKCTACDRGFLNQTRLDVHFKTRHTGKQRENTCPICQKAFYEKDFLAKHMRIHGHRVLFCPECSKVFTDDKFLRRHLMIHTQVKDYTCDVCGKVFCRASNFNAHRHIHTGERSYKCATCGQAFSLRHNLKAHEKIHTEIRPFSCETCGRGFRNKGNYEIHRRIHQGLKPYQCSYCLRNFSRAEHLQSHVNAHNGVRPYACQHCHKSFISSSNLTQHMRLHNGEKPFHCGSCGLKFTSRQNLQKHVKIHTKNRDSQYIVIWEEAGVLQEATVLTDGVPQNFGRFSELDSSQLKVDKVGSETTKQATVPAKPVSESSRSLTESATASEAPAGGDAVLKTAESDGTGDAALRSDDKIHLEGLNGITVDGTQLQLIDEHGNPVQNISSDQFVVLQDDDLHGEGENQPTVIEHSALLALAEGQTPDGTIYISEENLRALTRQGLMVTYEDQAQ